MHLKFLNLLSKASLVLLILNVQSAIGKRKNPDRSLESNSEDIEAWVPDNDDELPRLLSAPVKQIDFRGLVRSNLAMQVALKDPMKNSVCSPLSALLPLSKLVFGTKKGKTQEELLKGIGYKRDEVKSSLKLLLQSLTQLSGVTLALVSWIYLANDAKLHPKFSEDSKDVFQSTVNKLNFSNPSESVRNINKWVKKHTHGMIPQLLSPSDVPPTTKILIVNALYFEGSWLKPFHTAVASSFYSPMGNRRVPMMKVTNSFYYSYDEYLNAEIIELPYNNKNTSFLVVLPKEKNGLPMLLTAIKLAPKLLNKAMKGMSMRNVEVSLPKFKVRAKIDLKDMFSKIGIARVFKEKDLDKIVQGQSVSVSAAIQQAVVEVTETGTEAAAGTANIWATSGGILNINVKFNADHPLLFMVLSNNQQLFVGTYNSE